MSGCQEKGNCSNRISWRACSLHPCLSDTLVEVDPMSSWRDEQCRRMNSSLSKSLEFAASPCSLDCVSKYQSDKKHEPVRLAERVEDGTRCGSKGELRLCLAGVCHPLGCDLQLGSNAKLDRCGVCGGKGESCMDKVNTYTWEQMKEGKCSATCGGGRRVIQFICVESNRSGNIVHHEFCNQSE